MTPYLAVFVLPQLQNLVMSPFSQSFLVKDSSCDKLGTVGSLISHLSRPLGARDYLQALQEPQPPSFALSNLPASSYLLMAVVGLRIMTNLFHFNFIKRR